MNNIATEKSIAASARYLEWRQPLVEVAAVSVVCASLMGESKQLQAPVADLARPAHPTFTATPHRDLPFEPAMSEAPAAAEPSCPDFILARIFDAPREVLWRAWTDPQEFATWWGSAGVVVPVETTRIDLQVGASVTSGWQRSPPDSRAIRAACSPQAGDAR
ncbi:MAG: SRPBCC family protein [Candidatus Nanopelagicales bacterium]